MGLCSFLLPPTFLLPRELTPPAAGFGRDFLIFLCLWGSNTSEKGEAGVRKNKQMAELWGEQLQDFEMQGNKRNLLQLSTENSKKCIDGSVRCDLPWGKWSISKIWEILKN